MHKSKANLKTLRTGGGFSAIELLVTVTVLTIVSGMGFMGITRARASIRLSGAAREYASYIEKARIYSIRRHADTAAQRARVAIKADRTGYDVMMDLDGDGGMDTRTIPLPEGVSFETVETIAFDWRGRTWNTVGGVTRPNAQVSIRMRGTNNTISIDVTGSGDITIDSRVFDDSVPNVNLRVDDLASGAAPAATPDSVTPTPSLDLLPVPTPDILPLPSPTLGIGAGLNPLPTPASSPTATPQASPSPAATPQSTPSPSPSPTPAPLSCTLSPDQSLVTMHEDVTATIKVSVISNGTVSITGTSSDSSHFQVTGSGQSVSSGGFTTFSLKSKKTGTYSITFSSSCDTKTVPVVVLP